MMSGNMRACLFARISCPTKPLHTSVTIPFPFSIVHSTVPSPFTLGVSPYPSLFFLSTQISVISTSFYFIPYLFLFIPLYISVLYIDIFSGTNYVLDRADEWWNDTAKTLVPSLWIGTSTCVPPTVYVIIRPTTTFDDWSVCKV